MSTQFMPSIINSNASNGAYSLSNLLFWNNIF